MGQCHQCNNQISQQLTLRFTNFTVLTVIELHYKFWKWHNLQRSWNIENFLYCEHEIQKGGPQIMTSWYDDVVPGMLPHIWGRRRRCVFDLPYMHACVNTRVVPSSAAQMWYEGEKSDGHTVFSFVLNPKFRWSIARGRSRSPVSCARNAADDEDLQLG